MHVNILIHIQPKVEHPMKKGFWRFKMKLEDEHTSQGLNQIFEIINAKGDEGEIKKILEQSEKKDSNKLNE